MESLREPGQRAPSRFSPDLTRWLDRALLLLLFLLLLYMLLSGQCGGTEAVYYPPSDMMPGPGAVP